MALSHIRILFVTLLFALNTSASNPTSTTPQQDFSWPSLPDLSLEVENGDFVTISWNSDLANWFAYYATTADPNDLDLWCMDYNNHVFAHQVASQISVKYNLNTQWLINIPDDELNQASAWVFRFFRHGTDVSAANLSSDSVSSPGFYIFPAASLTTTMSSTTSSTSTLQSLYSSSLSTSSSSSPTSTSSQSSSKTSGSASGSSETSTATPQPDKLTAGALVGIILGVVIFLCIIGGAIWFRRCIRKKKQARRTAELVDVSNQYHKSTQHLYEVEARAGNYDNKDHTKHPPGYTHELTGAHEPVFYEMDGRTSFRG